MDLDELRSMADVELRKHQLVYKGWTFGFNENVRRRGVCFHDPRCRIEIAATFAAGNTYSVVVDVLRHEIAHALVGFGAGHGPVWKAKAIELGAEPVSCGIDDNPIKGRYFGVCPLCKRVFYMHRRPRLIRYRCPDDGGLFSMRETP